MSTNEPGSLTKGGNGLGQAGDDVMHAIGKLDEASTQLGVDDPVNDVDPHAVATWITVIGKALLAIFKP